MNSYKLIRSSRKTVAICVKPDGSVEVRAPRRAKLEFIEGFVKEKEGWIRATQEKMAARSAERRVITLTPRQTAEAKRRAKEYLAARCGHYAPLMGVDYRSIKVNSAKTRWGSCTSEGNLNFTYRLIFAEPELIDYIVVHELAHRREMNHSQRFWKVVADVMPDYRQRRAGLKEFQRRIAIAEAEEGD